MSNKLTIEEIKERTKDLPVELLSTEYEGTGVPMMWRHKECKHTFPRSFTKIKQTHKCPDCNGQSKVTIERIKQKLIEQNRPIEVISQKSKGAKGIAVWKCTVKGCEHEWEHTPDSILNAGVGCPKCGLVRPRQSREDFAERGKKVGLILISKRTGTVKDPLLWACEKHPEELFTYTPDTLKEMTELNCPACRLDEIKQLLIDKNRRIELLSDFFVWETTPMKWRCIDCGKTWWAPAARVMGTIGEGTGCSRCNKVTINFTNCKRHKKQWLKQDGIVYILKCFDEATSEKFYKIGVTIQNINKRLQKIPYTCEVLATINTNRHDMYYIEQELFRINSDNYYEPLKEFGGKTECFTKIIGIE